MESLLANRRSTPSVARAGREEEERTAVGADTGRCPKGNRRTARAALAAWPPPVEDRRMPIATPR
jgi:hypothetical protein